VRWVPSRLGKGRDGTYVHLGLGSRGLDGSEQWPVRGSAAPGLGGRGEPCSGEQAGRPGQCAGGQAQGGRGEKLEVLSRHGIGAGYRAHRGSTHGGAASGSASREAGDRGTFIVGTRRW
jgi:hypothetical protein